MQVPLAFKEMFWGLDSQEQFFKVGVPGPNRSFLREKLSCECPPDCGWLSQPLLFLCGFFLFCPVFRSFLSSFWVSFRGHCSVYSCRFSVSSGDESSCITILN